MIKTLVPVDDMLDMIPDLQVRGDFKDTIKISGYNTLILHLGNP